MMSTRTGVSLAAAGYAAIGLAFLFAADEVGRAVLAGAAGPLVQWLGAALLGFATMNWTARGAALGGIYGRALVVANQTHATIGALVLLRHGSGAGGSPAYWAVTLFYTAAALYFSYLAFFATGLRPGPKGKRD
jgi:hypothetical protein